MQHQHHHKKGMSMMSHGSAAMFLKRFWIVTFLLVLLVLLQPKAAEIIGLPTVPFSQWLQLVLATVIFGFSLVFFQHAWHEIKARAYGMMTLVSIAVAAGYGFSFIATFVPALEVQFYLEISTLIWVLLFGHYLEARSSRAAGDALSEVAKLLPKQAHKLVDATEIDVDIDTLKESDLVLVKPGEKIPADGLVVKGEANVDESLISGESKPIKKEKEAQVVAGSICLDGSLTIRLTRVGTHSTVGQIQQLIAEAGRTKPHSQRIADKAAAVLTFVALGTALLTLLVWTLVIGQTFVFAITLAITVLVIACPHALGLAIPTVTTITTALAVKNGFFIKDLAKLETIRQANYVVFDKTGTLTKGEFGVTKIVPVSGREEEVLQIAVSLEQNSSHIIARSILKEAEKRGLALANISDFKNLAGKGVQARIDDQLYYIGNEKLLQDIGLEFSLNDNDGTIALVANEEAVLGYIVLADAVKESAQAAVQGLHKLGIKVAMITGDNEQTAHTVANELGVDTYFAEVLPADKYTHIKSLQEEGQVVLMVGDGVNDAPALTQADAGIAVGSGTDVAVESGDVVLTDSDPEDIVRLLKLSKKVYVKMVQNLVWALGYNLVAIPAAAGVFAFWGLFLRPEIGALVMSLSTVIVVANAFTLKRVSL